MPENATKVFGKFFIVEYVLYSYGRRPQLGTDTARPIPDTLYLIPHFMRNRIPLFLALSRFLTARSLPVELSKKIIFCDPIPVRFIGTTRTYTLIYSKDI